MYLRHLYSVLHRFRRFHFDVANTGLKRVCKHQVVQGRHNGMGSYGGALRDRMLLIMCPEPNCHTGPTSAVTFGYPARPPPAVLSVRLDTRRGAGAF